MAVNPHGHLAVWGYEGEGAFSTRQFGFLYEADDGHLLTVFPTPELLRSETTRVFEGISGIGFNNSGELFAAFAEKPEMWQYVPEPVGELVTGSFTCAVGTVQGTSRTYKCTLAEK